MSPEEVMFEGEATQVITRTTEGDVAFLADHAAFLGALVENTTRVFLTDGSIRQFEISGGFVEVSNNTVSLLVT
ncbi:MAG: F0F1 ATP synthase subunit epsilon [Acidimicrobiia bacterium]|nr:F0F1 ATP synthase subunit epsilon [Acidimicrobiia bacterium]